MRLVSAQVRNFKSIEDSGNVSIDPEVTVLVGQNESGKTAFLQALHKARSIEGDVTYNIEEDYPRRGMIEYKRRHKEAPAVVAELTYELTKGDVNRISKTFGIELFKSLQFKVQHKYGGGSIIILSIDEKPYIKHLITDSGLTAEIADRASQSKDLRSLIKQLEGEDLNTEGQNFLNKLKESFGKTPDTWHSMLNHFVWKGYIEPKIPEFLYFDDYYLLPGKVNLPALQQRVTASNTAGAKGKLALAGEDKTVLSLLQMADVRLEDLTSTTGYENVKANLESISNLITDKVFEYWTQNRNLKVEFDIRPDPNDQPPFNSGNNLYIRIYNNRHRVSVPFSQRSKGFIWFFSFIVWFSSVKEQLAADSDIVLLLDEPGLSLHALAQADFLRYIDDLSKNHQVLYTTHSPFMVHNDRLHQTRTVQDVETGGTKISENISGSDPKTIFPLQAALGYDIAQNLFISKRNLLVEGPADLIYLNFFSSALEKGGRTSLRDDITIIPTGGLDKIATFVALLGGNKLEFSVLHDYESRPDPRLESLVRDKLIRDKHVLNYAMFRDGVVAGTSSGAGMTPALTSSDVEDLISPDLYLKLFSAAYKKKLPSEVKEADLPPGDRIVNRINRYLTDNGIQLRASGGFNHYLVANHLASNPPAKVDADTLKRFERLFQSINALYSKSE